MSRRREPGHIRAGLGDDHLRNSLPDTGDRLEELDLVRPRDALGGNDLIELGQRLLDHVQPTQDGLRHPKAFMCAALSSHTCITSSRQ